jgi:hypothetical protein
LRTSLNAGNRKGIVWLFRIFAPVGRQHHGLFSCCVVDWA